MEKIDGGKFTGERALFASYDLEITNSEFFEGESPLKESEKISLSSCAFRWKYPLWYCKSVDVYDTVLDETARSGIWYTHGITMEGCEINAPKTFRRSSDISLFDVNIPNAQETMWNCERVRLNNVCVVGDYFGMGCVDVMADNFDVEGNYLFDGASDIEVRNARLISKDAFWNCKNVTVYDSLIVGEYLGWNSENVTFVNCTIESNQGMCYMQNLTLRGCKFRNTDLCFEYCTVDAEVDSYIDSVKNPISGRIVAHSIGEIILEPDRVDVTKTEIEEVYPDV